MSSAGSTVSSSCRMPRRAAPRRRPCKTPRKRRSPARSPRARRGLPRRRTSNSCWRPTARCAGPAPRSASFTAGEEVLRPRVRIIADEHLTGAPRDAVEARLDRLVKSHIEKLLGPLARIGGRRRRDRHRARRRLPIGRGARRARSPTRRRGRQGPGAAGARHACANTACASAPITSICRRCSSRRRAARRATLGAAA